MRGIGGIMKGKQSYEAAPSWKVLRQWALAVPLFAVVVTMLFFVCDGNRTDKRENIIRKALDAGCKQILNSRFTWVRVTTVEGVEYEEFETVRDRKHTDVNVLIPKDASFIDGTDGELRYVVIYGREVRRTDEHHVIVEPFAMVNPPGSDIWESFALLVLFLLFALVVAIVEIVLVVKCLNAHDEWKEQERAGQV